jgi:hypothetical protein
MAPASWHAAIANPPQKYGSLHVAAPQSPHLHTHPPSKAASSALPKLLTYQAPELCGVWLLEQVGMEDKCLWWYLAQIFRCGDIAPCHILCVLLRLHAATVGGDCAKHLEVPEGHLSGQDTPTAATPQLQPLPSPPTSHPWHLHLHARPCSRRARCPSLPAAHHLDGWTDHTTLHVARLRRCTVARQMHQLLLPL